MECMDQDVGQSGHRQPRVPGMPAAAMGHGAGRYRPMPKTQMHGLSRHQGPQTIARSGRQASQQPVQFARRPVDAGILRQSIVPATNPHHGALGHGRGNSVSAESSPAKVSRGGRSAPRSKISGNVHSANVPRLGSYELTPVASCGKPRDRHPVPLRGTLTRTRRGNSLEAARTAAKWPRTAAQCRSDAMCPWRNSARHCLATNRKLVTTNLQIGLDAMT
ncbi:hypothetical protein SAMN05660473_00590 [Arthrobacter sp. 49Tsu3.1M3]|nr:hypothetical protein SAMN05660473_00590 [Arthrobacter sp. 49Tsu3.1M3]